MCKITTLHHFKRLEGYIKIDHSDKVLCSDKVFAENQYIQLAIIDELNEEASLMKEEVLESILPVFSYNKLSTIIYLINSRPKPLTIYDFIEDPQVKKQDKERDKCVCSLVEISGYGRCHGKYEFDACSNPKTLLM
jgi:aldehyde dehydrogenase (NAD+)